jgi:hypothetical protein
VSVPAGEVHYDVLVAYAQRKQDLEAYAKDIKDDPELCEEEGQYDQVTGDVDFFDVSGILSRLENPESVRNERLRVLGATSAISHGVDVSRLNVMMIMGLPKQTAEFIQATARVGRTFPGLVFSLADSARQREASHFRYFQKYIQYMDRFVEPVPVNRDSLQVLKRVLPGGFMAYLLQVIEPQWLLGNGRTARPSVRKAGGVAGAIDEGYLDKDATFDWLCNAFGIDPTDGRTCLASAIRG